MAVILGEEITHNDLIPIFNGFLKDLDEVRIGVLRHLADFLKVRCVHITICHGWGHSSYISGMGRFS